MSAALLHRRLTAGMSLAALAAFMAGAGASAPAVLAMAALVVAIVRPPPAAWSVWIERGSRVVVLGLCAWMLYVAFVLGQDFMPAVMAMLLFLLGAESLRALDARNDARLYLLAFALLLASTAYYPGLGFAAGFIGFVVLATLALMVGYLRRESERFEVPHVPLRRGTLLATIALSGVALLASATLFVVFPRLPRAWNVQGRPGGGNLMVGFSDQVVLGQHGGRIVANPAVALRVEFPDGTPADADARYWRGRSFDHFDGVQWTRTPRMPNLTFGTGVYDRWGGPFRRVRVFGGPEGTNVLFGSHPVVAVQARSAIRVVQETTGDIIFFGSDAPVYTVVSGRDTPAERLLRVAARPDSRLLRRYLQLPPGLDPRVRRLADSLTAAFPDRIDRVRAVETYLSTELLYTLELPRTRSEATVEGFLFRRREGHCEYFSTAMVMLLRAVAIPARNVTGFLGGEWNRFGGYLAVTGNDAHSWVEVWFPEAGWVPFDPTPASRNTLVDLGTGTGWAWPALLWFDGLEHRWYRWVLDYNLERQLDLFRSVGDLFSRGGRGPGLGRPDTPRAARWVPVLITLGVLAALALGLRRVRRRPLAEESRLYLALRRLYARAGVGGDAGPLDFVDALDRAHAPGAAPAGALVHLYVRARFGRERIGDDGRQRMRAALAGAAAELRAARRAARRRRSLTLQAR